MKRIKKKLYIAFAICIVAIICLIPAMKKDENPTELAEQFLLRIYTSDTDRYEFYNMTPDDMSVYKNLYADVVPEDSFEKMIRPSNNQYLMVDEFAYKSGKSVSAYDVELELKEQNSSFDTYIYTVYFDLIVDDKPYKYSTQGEVTVSNYNKNLGMVTSMKLYDQLLFKFLLD